MEEIKVAKKVVAKSSARDIAGLLKIGLIVLVVMWLSLTATIMRVIPSTSLGPTIVKNYTGPGGRPSPGDIVIVSQNTENKDFFVDRFRQAFVLQSDTVEVMVWATASKKDKSVLRPEHKKSAFERPMFDGEYLAICIKGDCEEGEQLKFKDANLLGERV